MITGNQVELTAFGLGASSSKKSGATQKEPGLAEYKTQDANVEIRSAHTIDVDFENEENRVISGERAPGKNLSRRNLMSRLKPLSRSELSGSLGDLGTFIPIIVSLVSQYNLDFGSTLIFAGFSNIVTGLMFEIPMAVQPMKAIAAVALSSTDDTYSIEHMLVAGIMVSAIVFLLGATNMISVFNRIIPLPVVRGLQLGLGLSLWAKAKNLLPEEVFAWHDSQIHGFICFMFALLCEKNKKIPSALILFALGLIFSIIKAASISEHVPPLSLTIPSPIKPVPEFKVWKTAFLDMALPQLPLTTLNSVIAVCKLSRDLFPSKPAKTRPVATSVGVMNLASCWFGAFPMCHGAGGLAAQYRFGARFGTSVVTLGIIKMILGIFFGQATLLLLQEHLFPQAILASMLAISGLELSMSIKDATQSRKDLTILIITSGSTLAYGSTFVGFSLGSIVAVAFVLRDKMKC